MKTERGCSSFLKDDFQYAYCQLSRGGMTSTLELKEQQENTRYHVVIEQININSSYNSQVPRE